MSEILRDVAFGLRLLLKRPGTSVLAIVALGLGIGLTTTMFSIVNAAVLRGLPFDDASRILYVGRVDTTSAVPRAHGTPEDDFVDWRAQQKSFDELAAWNYANADVSADGVTPARYSAARLTPNALRVLRVRPFMGRDFTNADAVEGAPPVALIGYAVWTNQFARDPGILARVIRISGEMTTIVGVMPEGFGFPQRESVWMPLRIALAPKRGDGPSIDVFARLKPGASLSSAASEMRAIGNQLAKEHHENDKTSATAIPFVRRFLGNDFVSTVSTMLAAVFGVLLIACVNVTNLQLARGAERAKEIALRLALGAGRARLIRQLVVEGVVLATLGAILGLAIAEIGVALFRAAITDTDPPFWITITLDPSVLLFAMGLTVIAALASSLLPAFQVTRQNVNAVLKDEGRSNTSLRVGRFSRGLVIVEITLSFCLLAVSGLMIKSVITVNRIDFPFRTDVLHARIDFSTTGYRDDTALRIATDRLRGVLAATSELPRTALASSLPDGSRSSSFEMVGQPTQAGAQRPQADRIDATPEFFDVLRIRVLRGRVFTDRDLDGTDKVAVVTEEFARRYFPTGDILGQQIRVSTSSSRGTDDPVWTVVGVVPVLSVAARSGSTSDNGTIILPLTQSRSRTVSVFVSGTGDPLTLTPALRRAVQQFDRDMPLSDVDSVKGRYARQTWPLRVFGALFMSFGVTALLLAAAGLYGVMAFSVSRRTPEIGVRMALGADRGMVLRMIVRQGLVLVVAGILLGLGIAGWMGSQMTALLFRVQAWDATVFGVTIAVLVTAGLTACLVPALRAASVDPLVALRHD